MFRQLSRVRSAVRRVLRPNTQIFQPWSEGGEPRVMFGHGTTGPSLCYRLLNQVEQLKLQGCAVAHYGDCDARLWHTIEQCDLLYLLRVQNTIVVQRALAAARRHGKLVLYDTDDITWGQKLLEYCFIRERYGEERVPIFLRDIAEFEAAMRQADAFVASTPFLAHEMRAYFEQPVYVNTNAVSQQFVEASEPLYRRRISGPPNDRVVIGYASGWPRTHEEDFGLALPAIRRVLHELPQTQLRIVGFFDIDMLPDLPRDQIEVLPPVPWEQIPQYLASVDINLAPILDNPHRRSKSAIKYLEAALVGTPTVASDLEPYQGMISGTTGFLARDEASWYHSIATLARDATLRRTIGRAAHDDVLAHDTTTLRAPQFVALLRSILAREAT